MNIPNAPYSPPFRLIDDSMADVFSHYSNPSIGFESNRIAPPASLWPPSTAPRLQRATPPPTGTTARTSPAASSSPTTTAPRRGTDWCTTRDTPTSRASWTVSASRVALVTNHRDHRAGRLRGLRVRASRSWAAASLGRRPTRAA